MIFTAARKGAKAGKNDRFCLLINDVTDVFREGAPELVQAYKCILLARDHMLIRLPASLWALLVLQIATYFPDELAQFDRLVVGESAKVGDGLLTVKGLLDKQLLHFYLVHI